MNELVKTTVGRKLERTAENLRKNNIEATETRERIQMSML